MKHRKKSNFSEKGLIRQKFQKGPGSKLEKQFEFLNIKPRCETKIEIFFQAIGELSVSSIF